MLPFQDLLIQQLKSQDPIAIEQLIDVYGSALYGFILRRVSTEEKAQKVFQDTFVKIWQVGEGFDETKDQLFNWLMKIAHKTAAENENRMTELSIN